MPPPTPAAPAEPTPLELKVDELITWLEENTADHVDLREALTAAGIRLGQRADLAYKAENEERIAARSSSLAAAGKTPLIVAPVKPTPAPAVEAPEEAPK